MEHLTSGTPYSLKEIFCGENDKIIIPDLQRDYCWGNPISQNNNESLVDAFMDSIFELKKDVGETEEITMGLIYGYYDKELMPYHLQLCDGQQRLTTLFLILGVIYKKTGNTLYQEIIISDFELNKDDKEPHLLYGIRESSLYFLSDLVIHYFLDPKLSLEDLDKQPWFLNSYNQDPTISSIRKAIKTIESKLDNYVGDINSLGEFLINRLKFLFYDMNDRQNGEETFVVINTTGEPLSANQNLKPLIISKNYNYQRIDLNNDGTQNTLNAAQTWEEMETWFWQNRRRNDADTSTEGMLAFLHCVRVLECQTEKEWYLHYETKDDKFPVSITMDSIWQWFCTYKRVYELDYERLFTPKISYPNNQKHYTQKDLYALLPTMQYCRKFHDVQDEDIQRIYHLFSNMARYRYVSRSSQNEAISVPAFRLCQMVKKMGNKDVLSFHKLDSFDVEEEKSKLAFLAAYADMPEKRVEIEELFAKAEDFSIYDGQISTLVKWSDSSIERFKYLFYKIKKFWEESPKKTDKTRQALLAYGIKGYPMPTGTPNMTLCINTEWRNLFEKQGKQVLSFLLEDKDLDTIIAENNDTNSPYYPLIHDIAYLEFSKEKKVRIHPQNVIEIMEKQRATGNFWLIHRGCVFPKNMVKMEYWNGFWIWSEADVSIFYTMSTKYNFTMDMKIVENGYQIIAWLERRKSLPSLSTSILSDIGFYEEKDYWAFPLIKVPKDAKEKFKEITQKINEHYLATHP
ncbi:MAG: DUF262 domain-containing protein [Prevotella sp.]|nr:DUF262 domain-containing protein [Prevotella sp.]